ncbi:hypothetical protein CWM88_13620, partial [Klebsiella pneumoniae]
MKFWRPGITGKLFLAIFATCIVLLISMHWAVRISFERGFIDYIKRGNEQRLTMLSDALSEQYAQHGSWAFLRNNDRFIFQLLRTFERDNDDRSPPGHAMKPDAAPDGPPPDGPPDGPRPRPEMPPHGWRTMFWVVDQSGRVLVGPRERVPEDGTQRSIVVNGAEVGKVIASPVERLTRNTDINFDRQQKRTSWLIVALATLLAALATFPLARGLLAPVKRLVEGTHKLAAGDFSTRVTVTGGDELGRLAQDFNQLASTLERNQQMRRDLMADISHELRTPLYGIIGNLDLLQTKALPKGVDRLVTAMNNSSSLLLKIISDILDFSKIESEQLKIEPREFSPREVMNHISANYLPLVVRKQLGLYCFIEPDVPEQMSGDPMRLQQVISNLLSNAIKFTDTGCIVLHVQCAGDYLQISVRDTGEGIPAKEVLRLFDPFFQVGTGVQRNFQGTGLGLAICEKLISMMDGDIAVETEPGMGSRFTIRIPLYGVQNTSPVSRDGFAGKTCWLAIHNTSLAMFVTSLLSYHGLTVRRHAGETPDAEDVLLTDDEALSGWQGRAMVIFCRRHIGIPQERSAGEWLHSVTTPHELLLLLGRIFHVALASAENSPALMAPEAQAGNNDDMMILVVDD